MTISSYDDCIHLDFR